jgi:Ca2+-binding EF-hand superfamily protein
LDKIIELAGSLKGHVGTAKGHFSELLDAKEQSIKKVHGDLESLQSQLERTSSSHKEERERLERQIAEKEEEQKRKVADYDTQIRGALAEKERVEREREAARGDAESEKRRLANLLGDLENDALGYSRLRPSKPLLGDDDIAIIRQLFLSSAVSGTGKLSFAELKQILAKYTTVMPEGALKRLFTLVEADTKGRMSYITVVGVANDLCALITDFRKIDVNSNNNLSRKEFKEHFHKLGFTKKDTIDAVFRYADEDDSDEVTFNEYVHLALALLCLRILFSFADSDKSGLLSKDEVQKLVQDAAVPESALKKFDHYFNIVDKDDTKTLGYVEFVMLIMLMFADD